MIRKIQSSEYLKRYDNMAAAERAEYESRVGDWLSVDGQSLVKLGGTFDARLQNVLQVSAGWNDQECQVFEEGAVLLSALVGTMDTWLPDMLYVKSAKRAVKLMFEALWKVDAGESLTINADGKPKAAENKSVKSVESVGNKKADQTTPGPSRSALPLATDEGRKNSGGEAAAQDTKGSGTSVSLAPARPRHIDQYAHLLPEKTQEHASHYGELMDELRASREKLDLLMEDKTATDKDREAWAKRVKKLDDQIGAIKRELDEGWDNLVKQGRVELDDLGMAHVVPMDNGKLTMDNEAAATEKQELSSEEKAKRRELRKWLVDTRRGNGDTREEHVKKWQENFKEFLAFEGEAAYEDEKIKAAAEHYGIELKTTDPTDSTDEDAKSSNAEN